jgi:copper resistance protein B
LQALYSRAISPHWDLQAGVRHDIKPNPSQTYVVIGMQGLAPYWFELDSALFLSEDADISVRVEAEYEFRLTQRLLLQPRLELNIAFSEDAEIGVGAGLSNSELGLRLRYEITREFAPYIGVSWAHAYGKTEKLQRAAGEDSNQLSFVAGLRFWF